jgi:hypothetical protein
MRSGEPPFDTPSGIPSDAGPPLDEHALEAELEAAEQEAAAAGRAWRNWSWVNRPITLWLLSTVAVGILSFAYAQYSACRSSFATDSSRFARLSKELVLRIGGVYGAAISDNATAGFYLFVLDPDRQFLFTEFKGRLPNELAAEVKQLLGKWHPSDAAESKSNAVSSTAPLDEAGLSFPRTIDAYVQQLLAEPGDIFDLLDAWIVMHRTLPLASSPESVAAVTRWARVLGTRALPYFDSNRDKLGSPSICFKRIWPFT